MSEFSDELKALMRKYAIKPQFPISNEEIQSHLEALKAPPGDLYELYKITNGLEKDWFRIFPLEDKSSPKKTWDNLQRANALSNTNFLHNHTELMVKFLIFAAIGGGNCAVIDRLDGTIWYQDQGLHQTDMTLIDFIETELREVSEL